MPLVRLHEVSKKYKLQYKDLAELLGKLGYSGKINPMAGVSQDVLIMLERHFFAEETKKENEAKQAKIKAEQDKKEAEAKAKAAVEAKKKAEIDAKKKAEAKAKREAEAKAKAEQAKKRAEAEAKAKREAEAKAKREAEAKAKAEAEAKAKREAEAKAKREAEAKAKAEAEAKARREAEEKARAEAEAKAKAEQRAKEERRKKETFNRQNSLNISEQIAQNSQQFVQEERKEKQRAESKREKSERERLEREKNAAFDKVKHDKIKSFQKQIIGYDEDEEETKQITIIKTGKNNQNTLKKKGNKNKNKRANFSKKVQAEMREAERQTEAILDRSKNTYVDEEEDELPKIVVPTDVTVSELAKYLDVDAISIVKKLFSMGVVASLNQRLEVDQIQLIGTEFNKEIVFSENVFEIEDTPDDEKDKRTRPPVVTVMGHVDHGKTSLIDYIRKAHVADKEVGGITQHIGAYQVKLPNGVITFIDTPGHEAFTAMRAQGALVTDIAVLIVAADDGVQPQTIEAIHHAQSANVPIIVAINKIDKPEANIDRVKQQLMNFNLVADDWGGQTTMVPISAKKGTGVADLLEMILLQAEIMELTANPNKAGIGTIIEARLDKGMGPMATVLIQNGKIQLGDHIICGTSYGRVKALINDAGARVKEAGPAFPAMILGLNEVPNVGDKMAVVESAKFARYVGELRQKKAREERLSRENRMKLADLFKRVTEGQAKELNIIIKADVQGSSVAIKDALERLSTDEVKVNVIHTGVGGITEADVNLASASNAIIIGFHVRPMTGVEEAAKNEDVEIKVFKIIYDAIDAVKSALKGLYDPEYEEEVIGRAEVRKVYKVSGVGSICGSYVLSGVVNRTASVRVIRDGIDVFEGKVASLKRFKDDAREVNAGYECGIGIENFNDVKEKDILEFFKLNQKEVVL